MDQETLAQLVADLIGRGSEGTYWDFKLEHHKEKWELVRDVLCLANANHDGPRFLVFGVRDGDCSVHSVEQDNGRRTQAEIATLFRDNARKFFQSRFPAFYLREVELDGALIDVLVIEDEPKKPFYLVERARSLPAHHIYTRVCDTNTAINAAAQPHDIERMWRERFGLDAPVVEKVRRHLAEPAAWSIGEEDGFVSCHHGVFPEFTLRAARADNMDCDQEWTRGEFRTDNNHAGFYELRYGQTLLSEVHYVCFDDRRKSMVAPEWEPIGKGRFYFYRANSLRFAVQRFWTARNVRDDSKHLQIPGDGESASEARARWPGGVDIPVLESGELEGFLEGQRWDALRGPDPTPDRDEQNDLFLRNLVDFDDWRRTRQV